MTFKEQFILFTAKGAGTGDIVFAPGTFGSLAALPVCYIFSLVDFTVTGVLLGILIALAVWIAGMAEKLLNTKDPSCIVIDEIAGMAVTLAGLPFNLLTVSAGFVFFRILDITKPVPIRTLERKLDGGIGIVADDVLAGIFANIILRCIMVIMG